jgi:hypothetical protein
MFHNLDQPDPEQPTSAAPVGRRPASAEVPMHDPRNTSPNCKPCKAALGLSQISDYQLTDQQYRLDR